MVMDAAIELETRAIREERVTALVKYWYDVDLTKSQARIIKALAWKKARRISIKAMTQWGKSYAVAIAVCLCLKLWRDPEIAIIAPTVRQSQILRNYVADFVLRDEDLASRLDMNQSGLERMKREVSKARLTFSDGASCIDFFSCEGNAHRLMGFGSYDLVIEDEAGDTPDTVQAKILRMCSKEGCIRVKIGNPWGSNEHFPRSFEEASWTGFTVSWRDAVTEGRVSTGFVEEARKSLTTIEFTVLYEAEFPDAAEDQLIPSSWYHRAVLDHWEPKKPELWTPEYRLDVAEGGGDRTVLWLVMVKGEYKVAVNSWAWKYADTMKTADRVHATVLAEGEGSIGVDSNGVGKGVADRLEQYGHSVIQIKTGAGAIDNKRFKNKGAELLWRIREDLEHERLSFVSPPPELYKDLVRYRFDVKTGKLRVTIEDGKSSGNSPDFGDALSYSPGDDALMFFSVASR